MASTSLKQIRSSLRSWNGWNRLTAKMHSTFGTISTLDWPSPEQLMAARRARGQAARDMTVALWRGLKTLAPRLLTPFKSSREHPARPDRDSVPRVTRETLARAWLEN